MILDEITVFDYDNLIDDDSQLDLINVAIFERFGINKHQEDIILSLKKIINCQSKIIDGEIYLSEYLNVLFENHKNLYEKKDKTRLSSKLVDLSLFHKIYFDPKKITLFEYFEIYEKTKNLINLENN